MRIAEYQIKTKLLLKTQENLPHVKKKMKRSDDAHNWQGRLS